MAWRGRLHALADVACAGLGVASNRWQIFVVADYGAHFASTMCTVWSRERFMRMLLFATRVILFPHPWSKTLCRLIG